MAQQTSGTTPHALDGVRVIDLADELAAYSSRLLADLGAEVIRVEPPGGASTRTHAPLVERDGVSVSAFDRFVNAGKRSVVIDTSTDRGIAELEGLLRSADIVIESSTPVLAGLGIDNARLRDLNPELGHVTVTPFGLGDAPAWSPSSDLIVMAAGGLLHLGGYPEVGPVVAYGGQSRFAASIFGAVAALAAILGKEGSGLGATYDVSAQECIAQALEDSAATYALTGRVRERQGDRPREAGTGVYACADGYVSMVAGRLGTARAWAALIDWINEAQSPGAEEMRQSEWNDFAYRQSEEGIERFGRIFGAFAQTRTKRELYAAAQDRKIALSPVSTIEDLLTSPQLAARDFFVDVPETTGGTVRFPGAPYRLQLTPAERPSPAPELGEGNAELLEKSAAERGA